MTQQRGEPGQMAAERDIDAQIAELRRMSREGMCYEHYRKSMAEGADTIEAQAAAVRDLAEALEEWASWYEGVRQDFAGFTDDARDADRLHDWTFIDGYRPAPELTALHTHAATVAAARRK